MPSDILPPTMHISTAPGQAEAAAALPSDTAAMQFAYSASVAATAAADRGSLHHGASNRSTCAVQSTCACIRSVPTGQDQVFGCNFADSILGCQVEVTQTDLKTCLC